MRILQAQDVAHGPQAKITPLAFVLIDESQVGAKLVRGRPQAVHVGDEKEEGCVEDRLDEVPARGIARMDQAGPRAVHIRHIDVHEAEDVHLRNVGKICQRNPSRVVVCTSFHELSVKFTICSKS